MPPPTVGSLLDRELYLPQGWAGDGERRREAGVPEEVAFQTKPQLARELLEAGGGSGSSLPLGHRRRGLRQLAGPAAVAGECRGSPRAGHQEQREAVGSDG